MSKSETVGFHFGDEGLRNLAYLDTHMSKNEHSCSVGQLQFSYLDFPPCVGEPTQHLRVMSLKGWNLAAWQSRLDNLIVEAITSLKEPSGSNKTSIAMHIEDQYWAPPNFKRLLSAKLKALTATGKLIKVKRKYRIAPASAFSEGRSSGMLLLEGKPRESLSVEKDDLRLLTKSQIDAELAKLRTMTAPEAAAAAARAVAEAEVAMAEAAAAAREAEAAEADAEAAQAFAEAAMMTLKSRNTSKLMVPG